MAKPHRVGDLEIDQDIGFQHKEWIVQRIGWVAMLLIVLLALAGLFSTGPLSSASDEAGDGSIAVDYQRFVRHDGNSTLGFQVDPAQAEGGELELWLSQGFVSDVEIRHISPQPTETRSTGDRIIYIFGVEQPTGPIEISFAMRPDAMGRLSGEAGVGDGATVSIDQISYP